MRKGTDSIMTAGLPGTGIGWLLYLLASLLLPLRYIWLCGRRQQLRDQPWRMMKQLAMSTAMITTMGFIGVVVEFLRPVPTHHAIVPFIITVSVLAMVLLIVEIGRLVIRPPARNAPARRPVPVARSSSPA